MSIRMVNVNLSSDESDGDREIVLRTNPRLWWMIPALCAAAIFYAAMPFLPDSRRQADPNPLPFIIFGELMALLIVLAIIYCLFDLLRGEIRANAEGLRWRRGFSNWKHARWDEVRDFYKRGTLHIVETARGKLELSRSFVGIEQIVEMVPHRALNAPAPLWETRGFRRGENWSLSLSLWDNSQKWTAPLMTLNGLCLIVAFPWLAAREPKRNAPVSMGFWLDVFPMLLMALLFVPIGLGMIWSVVTMWRERQLAWRRRNETLHLDARGLVFSGATQRIEARWDEVRQVRLLPREHGFPSVRVETERGDFRLWRLNNSPIVRRFYAVARDYAPDSLSPLDKQPELSDEIAPAPDEAQDVKVWSFRSYGNRLLILCVSLALVFAPLIYSIGVYSRASDDAPPSPSWPLLGGMGVAAVGIIAALWVWFHRARIVADDEGLELYSPFRRARRIAWSSLEEVGHSVWGDWIRADGHIVYFAHALSPVRKAELLGVLNTRKTS